MDIVEYEGVQASGEVRVRVNGVSTDLPVEVDQTPQARAVEWVQKVYGLTIVPATRDALLAALIADAAAALAAVAAGPPAGLNSGLKNVADRLQAVADHLARVT